MGTTRAAAARVVDVGVARPVVDAAREDAQNEGIFEWRKESERRGLPRAHAATAALCGAQPLNRVVMVTVGLRNDVCRAGQVPKKDTRPPI